MNGLATAAAVLALCSLLLDGCQGDGKTCRSLKCGEPSAKRDAGRPGSAGAGGDAQVATAPDQKPTDADGDLISDAIEIGPDPSKPLDTDGDGTPDYLDKDSDGDTIDDSVESGITMLGSRPIDSDADGTPDYLDKDSDDNGVPDSVEGADDPDHDKVGNFRDTDNDGDLSSDKLELGPNPAKPVDSDKDGTPDYLDDDSDGDTIADLEESGLDTDGDGTADRLDDDSDGDGILDRDEAGDADVHTRAVDTDGDGTPDFRDSDSDADGIPDQDEAKQGTDRLKADTDGDGVLDLVEIVACSSGQTACAHDATDPKNSPRTRGNFVFFEPYQTDPSPPRDTLAFQTKIKFADVYFLMDTTGSMGGTIDSLKTSLSTPTTGLIDRIRAEIPNVRFGVGSYRDYGDGVIDRAYKHVLDLTSDQAAAQSAVNTLAADGGGDGPEALFPALYSMATGLGLDGTSGWTGDRGTGYEGFGLCPKGSFGWPCFSFDAVPIVVVMTDAPGHNGPDGSNAYTDPGAANAPKYPATIHALGVARARVIGIAAAAGEAQTDLERLAKDTGTVDAMGNPLVVVATAVGDAVANMVRTLASQTPMDISVQFVDDSSDKVDSQAAFLDHLEARVQGDSARGCKAYPAADTDGDGAPDTFQGVTPGDKVCFDVVVKQNTSVEPTRDPQLFAAALRVVGQGRTELDRRDIYFLVPPVIKLAEVPIVQ
jgi:hypothetical protein